MRCWRRSRRFCFRSLAADALPLAIGARIGMMPSGYRSMTARMRLVRHRDPQTFIDAATPLLNRHRAGYSGLLTWARALGQAADIPEAVVLATVEDRRGPIGVGLQRPPGPLVIGDSDPRAAAFMARALGKVDPALPGVLGGLESCEAFARDWRATTGRVHRPRFKLRNYALGDLVTRAPVPGRARAAISSEADSLADWIVAFIGEVGVPDDLSRIRTTTANRIAAGLLWLWDDDGACALVGFQRVDDCAARIAPVYTPPRHRGRGYAGALVAAVAGMLREQGSIAIYLTADLANDISNRLYLRLGFVPAGDQFHFEFVLPAERSG